jgi:hypothetical protein
MAGPGSAAATSTGSREDRQSASRQDASAHPHEGQLGDSIVAVRLRRLQSQK